MNQKWTIVHSGEGWTMAVEVEAESRGDALDVFCGRVAREGWQIPEWRSMVVMPLGMREGMIECAHYHVGGLGQFAPPRGVVVGLS